jgi:hypothetical protein
MAADNRSAAHGWRSASGTAWQRDTAAVLIDALEGIGTSWTQWRQDRLAVDDELPARSLDDVVDDAVTLGRATGDDGRQRALDYRAADLEELQELRVTVNEALMGVEGPEGSRTRSWLWNAQTSGGSPMTQIGEETGYELRFRSRCTAGDLHRVLLFVGDRC